jgi:hypothetical protein
VPSRTCSACSAAAAASSARNRSLELEFDFEFGAVDFHLELAAHAVWDAEVHRDAADVQLDLATLGQCARQRRQPVDRLLPLSDSFSPPSCPTLAAPISQPDG